MQTMNGKRLLLVFSVPQFKFCYTILRVTCVCGCGYECSGLIKCKLKTGDRVNEHQEKVVVVGLLSAVFFTLQLCADKRDSNCTFLSFYAIFADYVKIFKFHFIRKSSGRRRNEWVHIYFYLCFCCFKFCKQLKMWCFLFHFTRTSLVPFAFVGFFLFEVNFSFKYSFIHTI